MMEIKLRIYAFDVFHNTVSLYTDLNNYYVLFLESS